MARFPLNLARRRRGTQFRRRASVKLTKDRVEAANARKAGSERDLGHGKAGFVDQPLCEMQPPGLRHSDRGGAEVAQEQSPEMARTDAQAGREIVDARAIQSSLVNQPERP
jgi:hypothetical protein